MQETISDSGTKKLAWGIWRRRILLVNADLGGLLFYSAILQHEGYEVRSVASHKEAVARLRQEEFDLIILIQGSPGAWDLSGVVEERRIDSPTPILTLFPGTPKADDRRAAPSEALHQQEVPSGLLEVVAKYLRPAVGTA
jgi:CheY-like chemotaxis protein